MLHPLFAGALVLALQPAGYGDATRFAELAPGQHVVVRYAADGCFGNTRARIALTGTATGVRYTATEREWVFRSHTRSGELSRGDASRLDRTMDQLRAPRRGEWCTTHTRVEVSRTIAGVPISREVYTNRSCRRDRGAISFWELLPE